MVNETQALVERYLRFAQDEARNLSPLYEGYARSVASNAALLRRLRALPRLKQQPNLVFAAVRFTAGLPEPGADFATHALDHWDAVEPVILERSTQTNEPGRCACLLPALAMLQEPIALLEVGASAGLCLLPDDYGYRYSTADLAASDPSAPVFPCRSSQETPIPNRHPDILWRAGLDLNPLDVSNDADMLWLQTLVWPEQASRLDRLKKAIAVAQKRPPNVVAGDLLGQTEALARQCPPGATLVIFHTAVLNYVEAKTRKSFCDLVRDIGAVWLSNEGERVLPDVAVPQSVPGAFVLARDGQAIARTGPHGQFIDWIAGSI